MVSPCDFVNIFRLMVVQRNRGLNASYISKKTGISYYKVKQGLRDMVKHHLFFLNLFSYRKTFNNSLFVLPKVFIFEKVKSSNSFAILLVFLYVMFNLLFVLINKLYVFCGKKQSVCSRILNTTFCFASHRKKTKKGTGGCEEWFRVLKIS